ncbi:MAG: DUF975 family protein [Bacillota bacterium]|nr:DUF975 family protein [Bacillota bacterium]
MWERATLKSYAKQELKISYWLSFAVCIVASILGGGSRVSFNFNFNDQVQSGNFFKTGYNHFFSSPIFLFSFFSIFTFALIFTLCFIFFVTGPINVGKASFFVRATRGQREFGNLFFAFKKGHYLKTAKTMFITNLIIFGWTLLFIIPGIVASYRYRMVPYILSDNPNLTTAEALQMSREMTDGEKFNMFVLDLSFIGWILLGLLACCIGVIFLAPYIEATWAQLYNALCYKMNVKYGQPNNPQDYPPMNGQQQVQ